MKNCCFLLLLSCFHFYAFTQPGTEIILFDITQNSTGITLTNPVNITSHKGYDNQPFFYRSAVYYSSQADSNEMDIKRYDYKKNSTSTITHTVDNEFSPTVTPDGKFISCILQRKNGKQDLVKYPLNGGDPAILIDDLKVGYHTWVNGNSLLLFVLEDTSTNGLHYLNLKTKQDARIAARIGRSLHKIPGSNSFSFIQKDSSAWFIKKYEPLTKKISTIMETLPGREDICWTTSGVIITSDGKEIYSAKAGGNWEKVKMTGDLPLKNITRFALNEQNTKLAVVISE